MLSRKRNVKVVLLALSVFFFGRVASAENSLDKYSCATWDNIDLYSTILKNSYETSEETKMFQAMPPLPKQLFDRIVTEITSVKRVGKPVLDKVRYVVTLRLDKPLPKANAGAARIIVGNESRCGNLSNGYDNEDSYEAKFTYFRSQSDPIEDEKTWATTVGQFILIHINPESW